MDNQRLPTLCPRCGSALEPGVGCTRCVLEVALEDDEALVTDRSYLEHLPEVGDRIAYVGDYELLELIARGGMGMVYKARQSSLNRVVALKILPGGLLAHEEARQRFKREAEAAAKLRHPNIVTVYEVGEEAGQPYFSMDFVAGRSLAELVREQPLSARRAATYLKTIAEAIAYAHQQGILHRDLKPSNVLVDADDRIQITDFGLAKDLTNDLELTQTGEVLGSPGYLPPEQVSSRKMPLGPASDIYSLGALMYHLLTGRRPFLADTLAETLRQVVEVEPVPPQQLNPAVPRDLATICLKCLAKEPGHRYQTATALAEELGRYLEGKPIQARPVGPGERAWRWCRRNPVTAGLVGVIATILLLGLTGIVWQWHRAQTNERRAVRNLYAADMILAQQSLEESHLGNARRLLAKYGPPSGAKDLRGWEWRHLWQVSRGDDLMILGRHSNIVTAVAFSPDGKWLASAGLDRRVQLWSCDRARPSKVLPHASEVTDVCFIQGGRTLVTGSSRGIIGFWNVETGILERTMGRPGIVTTLDPSPDETLLAAAGEDWVRVWEMGSGKLVAENYTGHKIVNAGVAFSPDGRTLAYGLPDGAIILWDVTARSPVAKLPGHRSEAVCLRFSPDGARLVSGSMDPERSVKLWNVAERRWVANLATGAAWISQVRFSPDGTALAISSADQVIRLLYTDTWQEKAALRGHVDEVWALAFSADGRWLASGGRDRTVRLWNPKSGARSPGFTTRAANPGTTALPKHGGAVLALHANHTYMVVSLPEMRSRRAAITRPEAPTAGTVSPNGWVVAVGLTNGAIWLRDDQTGKEFELRSGAAQPVVRMEYAPDGERLVALRADCTLEVWDVATRQKRFQAKTQGTIEPSFCLSRRGDVLAFVTKYSSSVELWDVARQAKLPPLDDPYQGAGCDVALSSDGTLAAVASFDGLVKVWEVATGRRLMACGGQLNVFLAVGFTADERRIAASGSDGTLRLWDLESQQMICRIRGKEFGNTVSFSFPSDGNTLVSLSTFLNVTRLPTLAQIDLQEAKAAPQSVRAGFRTANPAAVLNSGQRGLRRQIYLGIPGLAVSDLTRSTRFPDYPDEEELVPTFESTSLLLTNYGERLSGYLVPPCTGDYTFYLSADDQAQLWLSTDEGPAHKRLIVQEESWSAPRNWVDRRVTWDTAQVTPPCISAPISLQAGQAYYVELLHKQAQEADSAGVTWQLPGEAPPRPGSEPIPGQYLRPALPAGPAPARGIPQK